MKNPFRYFNSSAEVIHLTVLLYIRYPLSLRQVEDLLFERGIDICYETVPLALQLKHFNRRLEIKLIYKPQMLPP
jgi:transposase-like protein